MADFEKPVWILWSKRAMDGLWQRPPVLQDAFEPVTRNQIHDLAGELGIGLPKSYIDFLTSRNGGCFRQMAISGSHNKTHVELFYSVAPGCDDFDLRARYLAHHRKIKRGLMPIGSTGLGRLLLIRSVECVDSPVFAFDYTTGQQELICESVIEFFDSVRYSPQQDRLWNELERPFTYVERGDIKQLTAYTKSLSVKNDLGQSPLACAAASLQPRVVEYLLQLGVDPNEADQEGMTPLMLAARSGGVEICKTLVENGANVELTNCDGLTAAEIAIEDDIWRVKKLLLE